MDIIVNIIIGKEAEQLKVNLSSLVSAINGIIGKNVVIDANQAKEKKAEEKPKTPKRTAGHSQPLRTRLSHDEVLELVINYETATKDKGLKGASAIAWATKESKLTIGRLAAEHALFSHNKMKGYEDIWTPVKVPSRLSTINPDLHRRIEKVKFLYTRRNYSAAKISELLGEKPDWVKSICSGKSYYDVVISPDTERELELIYPAAAS